jgi:hypothetical protein
MQDTAGMGEIAVDGMMRRGSKRSASAPDAAENKRTAAMRHDGETRRRGIDFVSLMKEPSTPRSVRLRFGSMMHWICSNGSADSDVIVSPAIISAVDQAPARPRRHEVATVWA